MELRYRRTKQESMDTLPVNFWAPFSISIISSTMSSNNAKIWRNICKFSASALAAENVERDVVVLI